MELGKLNYVKEHNVVVESVILAAAGYIRSIFQSLDFWALAELLRTVYQRENICSYFRY